MPLGIEIKVDPGASASAADKVTASLHKTEDQGEAARKAVDNLSGTFKRLAQTMALDLKREQDALAQRLGSAGRAFDGLTEAIRREQQMLERIHGPMRQAEQDVQTLDMLHQRGAISAKEYINELSRLSKTINSTPGAPAMTGGINGATSSAAQLNSIAANVSKLNVGQIASGVNQGFELLNQKLQITDSRLGSVIGSTVKFGALGAQVGGPWGAALGGIAGAAVDMFSKFTDGNTRLKKELEEQAEAAKAYWEAIHAAERQKRIEEELGPIMEEHARAVERLNESHQTLARVMSESADVERHATDAADAYWQKLNKINYEIFQRLQLEGKLPKDITKFGDIANDPTSSTMLDYNDTRDAEEAIKAARGYRDAQLQAYAATKSYGDTLVSIGRAENARNNRLRDLEQILGDIDFNRLYPEAGKAALKEYNDLWRQQHGILKGVADDYVSLHGILVKIVEEGRNLPGAQTPGIQSATQGFQISTQIDPYAGGITPGQREAEIARAQQAAKVAGYLYDQNKAAKELEEHVTSINDLFADQLVGSAKTFSDTLVDAANGAEVSWSNFGKQTLAMFEQMIARALVLEAITGSVTGTKGADGWGGLLGALGFSTGGDALAGVSGLHRIPAAATGYDGIVPGAGSTDSRLAMIRVTPGESIHVRTPEQRRAAAASGGSTTIQNVFQFDKRSLLPILSSPDGKAAIVNVVRENPELMRALLR